MSNLCRSCCLVAYVRLSEDLFQGHVTISRETLSQNKSQQITAKNAPTFSSPMVEESQTETCIHPFHTALVLHLQNNY